MNPMLGGPSQGIRNSIPALQQLGINNEIVCFDDPAREFIIGGDLTIHALGDGKGPWCYNSKFVSWLSDNLMRFDVVVIHGLWLYHSFACFQVWNRLKKAGKGTVPRLYVMPHGMLDPYFQESATRKLKAIRNRLYWQFIEGKIINNADGILFTTEDELTLARRSFRPYHPRSELNIGYGIPAPQPYNKEMKAAFLAKCPELKEHNYLLFLSRIHAKKGIDQLIKVYIQLADNGIKMPRLVIAGPGMDTAFGKDLAREAAKTESILFPGMLTGDAKWGAFYGCEAFILPSHQENFGIALVEAMACGKPVLTTCQVNIWKDIEKGEAGLICEDNEESIRKQLLSWNEMDIARKIQTGVNALRTYNQRFSIESNALLMATMLGYQPEATTDQFHT
ncbi:MAG: glycosyl transferase family 1 [Citrobacter freundii]|nr:MAG: glycosyl transferase family 1 [Citrobacter freundii]